MTDLLPTKAKAAPVVTDVPTATVAAPVVTDLLPTKAKAAPVVTDVPTAKVMTGAKTVVNNTPVIESAAIVHTDGASKLLTKNAPATIDHVPTDLAHNILKVKSTVPVNELPTVDGTIPAAKPVLTKSNSRVDVQIPDATNTSTKPSLVRPDVTLVHEDGDPKVKPDVVTSVDSTIKVAAKSLVPPVVPLAVEPTTTTPQSVLNSSKTRAIDPTQPASDFSLVSHTVAKPVLSRAEADGPAIEIGKNGKTVADLAASPGQIDTTRNLLNKLSATPVSGEIASPIAKTRSGGDSDSTTVVHDAPLFAKNKGGALVPESVSLTHTDGSILNKLKLSDPVPGESKVVAAKISTSDSPGLDLVPVVKPKVDLTVSEGLLSQVKSPKTNVVDAVDATHLTRVDAQVGKPPASVKVTPPSDITQKNLPADVTPPAVLSPARAINLVSSVTDPTLDVKRHSVAGEQVGLKPAVPTEQTVTDGLRRFMGAPVADNRDYSKPTTESAVLKKSSEIQLFEAANNIAVNLYNNKKSILEQDGRTLPRTFTGDADSKPLVKVDSSGGESRRLIEQAFSDTRTGASPINLTKVGKSDVEPSFGSPDITKTVGIPPAKTDYKNLPADIVTSGVSVASKSIIVPDAVPHLNPQTTTAMDVFRQLAKPGQEHLLRDQSSPNPRSGDVAAVPNVLPVAKPALSDWQLTNELKNKLTTDGDYSRLKIPSTDGWDLKTTERIYRADSSTFGHVETISDPAVKKAFIAMKDQHESESRLGVGKSVILDQPSTKTTINTPPDFDTTGLRPSIVHARSGNDLRVADQLKDPKIFGSAAGRETGAIGLSGVSMNGRPVNAEGLKPQIEALVSNNQMSNQEWKEKFKTLDESSRTSFTSDSGSLRQQLSDIARTNPTQIDKLGKILSTSSDAIVAGSQPPTRTGLEPGKLGGGPAAGSPEALVRTTVGPDGRPVQVDASGKPVPASTPSGGFGPSDSRLSTIAGAPPPAWANAKLPGDRVSPPTTPAVSDQGAPRGPNGAPLGSPVVRGANNPGVAGDTVGGTAPSGVVRDGGPRLGPGGAPGAPGRVDVPPAALVAGKVDLIGGLEPASHRVVNFTDGRIFADLTGQSVRPSEISSTGKPSVSHQVGVDVGAGRVETGLVGKVDTGDGRVPSITPVTRGDAIAKGLGITGGAPGASAMGDHTVIQTGREVQVTTFDPQGRAITTTKYVDQSGRVVEGVREPQVKITGLTTGTGIPGEIDVQGSVAGVGRIPLSGNIRVSDWQPIREPGAVGQLTGDGVGRVTGMRGFQINGDGKLIPGRTEVRAPRGETHRYITGLELALILSIAGIAKLRGDSRAAARLEGRVWSIGRQNGRPVIFVDGRNNPFQVQRVFGRGDGSSFRIMVAIGDSQSRLSTRSMRAGELSNGLQSDVKVRPLNMSLLGRYHDLNYFGKSGAMNNFYGQFRSTSYTGGMGLAFVMATTGMARGPVDGMAPADRINITQAQNASSLMGQINRFSVDGKVAGNGRKGDQAAQESEDEQAESALDGYEDFMARIQGFAKRKGDDADGESASMRKPIMIGTKNLYDLADDDEIEEEEETEEDDTVDNAILSKVLRRPKWVLEVGQTLDGIAERLFSNPDVGWLIADLNRGSARETFMDGRRIVEFSSRQEIELPVHQDIQKFNQAKKKGCNAENLVTIVVERHVEREAVESILSKVIGAESA
ncbi:MAG: hypothetical protein K2X93_15850 [Candidatus Obscuribacterales bacterium]|nr:hypothetical protein [Candidatus Obscuribacterales bacterium]